MVMDSQPSPQSVGREFVRQYYTLLNKAPSHLHRFYNNNSSFIHGGLDIHNREAVLVIGQKNIHNKIQQLNFRDCHAKISQVDAQATLGGGVVVQVTGELSNDGQPMRRFTQTFVLAAQSPKNYYVHNDIFRYQDLYSDDENEQVVEQNNDENETVQTTPVENNKMGNSELIVNTTPTPGVITNATAGQQTIYYAIQPAAQQSQNIINASAAQVAPVAVPVAVQPQVNGLANNTPVNDEIMQTTQQTSTQNAPAAPSAAAAAGNSTLVSPTASSPTTPVPIVVSATIASTVSVSSTPAVPAQTQTGSLDLDSSKTSNDSNVDLEKNNKEDTKIIEPSLEKVEPMKNTANEPKTYANLLKSSSGVPGGLTLTSGFVPLPPASNQINSYAKLESNQQNASNQSPASLPQRQNSTRQNKDYSDSVRRTSNTNSYGDANQLFLGNVPHIATEEDLKSVFSKFGTVVDLRLHLKNGTKTPGQRNTPNYGFITYEDPEAVQKCLANTPIYYPDAEGQKLNVEEKKPRLRQDMPNHRPISNNGNLAGSQRSGGGGPNRSLSNSGGGGLMRNSSGGPRTGSGGGFNRSNDNRGGQQRQNSSGGGGGGGYNRR